MIIIIKPPTIMNSVKKSASLAKTIIEAEFDMEYQSGSRCDLINHKWLCGALNPTF
jgi:hypothetical protein